MTLTVLALALPDAVGRLERRRRVKRLHEDNLDRLRRGSPVLLPDAGEAEDSLSGRSRDYHELTKEKILTHGEEVSGGMSGPVKYDLPTDVRKEVVDLTEMTAEKIRRQNRRAYIAAFAIGVLVFGPFVTFVSYVL